MTETRASEIRHHKYLLLSTLYDTRLILLSDKPKSTTFEELDASQLPGLIRDAPTLAAGNLKSPSGDMIVQITSARITIIQLSSGMEVHSWTQGEIVVASVNPVQICVALKGGKVVYLTFDDERGLIEQGCVSFPILAEACNRMAR